MRTIALTLAYDGSGYAGWQRQRNGVSIQQVVEEVLASIEEAPVTVHASGRTDAGVHALAQVVSCRMAHLIPCDVLVRAMNARLPSAIRVIDAAERAPRFHARFSSTQKAYAYRVWNARIEDPFEHQRAWFVPQALDLEAMRAALAVLVGTHDFAAFEGPRSSVRDTTRTVIEARLDECRLAHGTEGVVHAVPGRLLVCNVVGDGFLRHMVRTMVGTLVDIGRGARPAASMADILASRDRRQAGRTAPPHGLYLARVEYADHVAPPLEVGDDGQ